MLSADFNKFYFNIAFCILAFSLPLIIPTQPAIPVMQPIILPLPLISSEQNCCYQVLELQNQKCLDDTKISLFTQIYKIFKNIFYACSKIKVSQIFNMFTLVLKKI